MSGRWGTRIRSWFREHPILGTLLALYLALSAVELVRILLHDRPRTYDAGFYQWETERRDGDAWRFHWTRGDESYLLRPLWAPVVRIPLYLAHPEPPAEGVPVEVRLEDRLLDRRVLPSNGWHDLTYYLPPFLSDYPWGASYDYAAESYTEPRIREEGDWFVVEVIPISTRMDFVRTFTDWKPAPGPPPRWLELRVGETFVPARFAETDDERELGVGVGELRWRREVPPEGIGFHVWEEHEGTRFRWMESRASMPLRWEVRDGATAELVLELRVPHPDAGERPVTARLLWGATRLGETIFEDNAWHTLRFPAPEGLSGRGLEGVLSFHVDRAWNPSRAGVSADPRDLALGMRPVRWE